MNESFNSLYGSHFDMPPKTFSYSVGTFSLCSQWSVLHIKILNPLQPDPYYFSFRIHSISLPAVSNSLLTHLSPQ
jgi:hypothetical protein